MTEFRFDYVLLKSYDADMKIELDTIREWERVILFKKGYGPGKSILTWYGRHHDPLGGPPRARPNHCTPVGLTPAIAPNVGDSSTKFFSVGICVRANPRKIKYKKSSCFFRSSSFILLVSCFFFFFFSFIMRMQCVLTVLMLVEFIYSRPSVRLPPPPFRYSLNSSGQLSFVIVTDKYVLWLLVLTGMSIIWLV